jgi:hypothetical protein
MDTKQIVEKATKELRKANSKFFIISEDEFEFHLGYTIDLRFFQMMIKVLKIDNIETYESLLIAIKSEIDPNKDI